MQLFQIIRLKKSASQKIKKTKENLTLELVKNQDILSFVANLENKPLTVGFAAETINPIEHAKKKLKDKNCDMIVSNLVGKNLTFDKDSSSLTLISRDKEPFDFGFDTKRSLSYTLLNYIYKNFVSFHGSQKILPEAKVELCSSFLS